MKIKDIRELSDDQLSEKLNELSQNTFNYRMTMKIGNLEDTSVVSANRKDIAKIKTILNERNIAEKAEA